MIIIKIYFQSIFRSESMFVIVRKIHNLRRELLGKYSGNTVYR